MSSGALTLLDTFAGTVGTALDAHTPDTVPTGGFAWANAGGVALLSGAASVICTTILDLPPLYTTSVYRQTHTLVDAYSLAAPCYVQIDASLPNYSPASGDLPYIAKLVVSSLSSFVTRIELGVEESFGSARQAYCSVTDSASVTTTVLHTLSVDAAVHTVRVGVVGNTYTFYVDETSRGSHTSAGTFIDTVRSVVFTMQGPATPTVYTKRIAINGGGGPGHVPAADFWTNFNRAYEIP